MIQKMRNEDPWLRSQAFSKVKRRSSERPRLRKTNLYKEREVKGLGVLE